MYTAHIWMRIVHPHNHEGKQETMSGKEERERAHDTC